MTCVITLATSTSVVTLSNVLISNIIQMKIWSRSFVLSLVYIWHVMYVISLLSVLKIFSMLPSMSGMSMMSMMCMLSDISSQYIYVFHPCWSIHPCALRINAPYTVYYHGVQCRYQS